MSVETIRRHHRFEPEAYHELIDRQSAHGTVFVSLSPTEAAAILAVYGARFISKADACTNEHLLTVHNLTNRIQKVLTDSIPAAVSPTSSTSNSPQEVVPQNNFVRLSSRSPKDGIPFSADQLRSALLQLLRNHGIGNGLGGAYVNQPSKADPEAKDESITSPNTTSNQPYSPTDEEQALLLAVDYDELMFSITNGVLPIQAANEFSCAAFALMHQFMKVTTADEVMALLTSSERVAIDLSRALDAFEQDPSSWRQHICLRAWESRIQDRLEFRCFVHENELTAISQYNTYVIINELEDPAFRQRCYEALVETWRRNFRESLRDIGSYVCDLAYCASEHLVLLIELNPPEASTGSGLFDWQRDAQILNGLGVGDPPPQQYSPSNPPLMHNGGDDITIDGEAASAVYVEEVVLSVVCRARVRLLDPQQLCALIHMFVGETLRELYSPRERWNYEYAIRWLQTKTEVGRETDMDDAGLRVCSQRITCLIL